MTAERLHLEGFESALSERRKNSHLSVTVSFLGCGGRTRTYYLRVMSRSQPNFPLPHNNLSRLYRYFLN
jgi:hypothetical protein